MLLDYLLEKWVGQLLSTFFIFSIICVSKTSSVFWECRQAYLQEEATEGERENVYVFRKKIFTRLENIFFLEFLCCCISYLRFSHLNIEKQQTF